MYEHDEFLWSGLRRRLERMGHLRPGTIRPEAVAQRPNHSHAQVRIRPTDPALRPPVQPVELARR